MPLIADTDTVIRGRKTIGLLDHLGGGNLGDDATLQAVMQNIKSRWPDAEIVGLSMNPDDTQRKHGIAAYPIRWPFIPRNSCPLQWHDEYFALLRIPLTEAGLVVHSRAWKSKRRVLVYVSKEVSL
jgi:polysaccharide pyruvyl transferase WcaK-like protein